MTTTVQHQRADAKRSKKAPTASTRAAGHEGT